MPSDPIVILGFGISGIIAKKYFGDDAVVLEASDRIKPTNHGVMRTDDERVGQVLGLALKPIEVRKFILFKGNLLNGPNFAASNSYSLKVAGCIDGRSIFDVDSRRLYKRYLFDYSDIAIAGDKIFFSSRVDQIRDGKILCSVYTTPYSGCISTIPMPRILDILGIPSFFGKNIFKYYPIFVDRYRLKIPSNVHQTLYVADSDIDIYRVTLEDQDLIVESVNGNVSGDPFVDSIAGIFGFGISDLDGPVECQQPYGKIIPLEDDLAKTIVYYLTEKYRIYSLGRFALWKPKVKIKDTIDDVLKIKRMINLDDRRRDYESKLDAIHTPG